MTDYDEVGPWGPEQDTVAFDELMATVRRTCPLSVTFAGRPILRFYEEACRLAPPGFHVEYTEVRLWLEQHGTTTSWGTEEWHRIGTDSECIDCGKPLRLHLNEFGPGYGFASDDVLHLHRDCSGNLFHL